MSVINKIKVAVIGATGYTGLDLVLMLSNHPKVKIKTHKAAIAGRVRGSTIFKKILNSEVPSILAASNNSLGRAFIKFLINKVQKPV